MKCATKICSKCKLELLTNKFYKRGESSLNSSCKKCDSDYYHRNKDKILKRHKEYYDKNHTAEKTKENYKKYLIKIKDRLLKKFYNINLHIYDQILNSQDGVCNICKGQSGSKNGYFYVDHDHSCCPGKKSCGKCIRGLLCQSCNSGLGSFRDSILFLQNAIYHLSQYKGNKG